MADLLFAIRLFVDVECLVPNKTSTIFFQLLFMERKVKHFAEGGVTPSPCLQVIISVDCNTQVIYFSVKSGTEIGRLRIGSFRPCPVRRDVHPPLSLPMAQRGVEDNSASDEA